MDPIIGGSLIGAGSSLVGGLMGRDANRDHNAQAAAQAAANMAMQREFAQNGIRWKVEDAKAAGIHPLYALGASTPSFSPVSLGTAPDQSMSTAMADMGQNISRAVSSTRTAPEKELATIQLAQARAQLDGSVIDNQIKAVQLKNLANPSPSFPGTESGNFIPGQGNSPLVRVKPSERSVSADGRPAQQAGWVPDVGYSRTDTGLTPVPSQDVKERIEDQLIPELMWAARNQLAPNLGTSRPPPKNMLPKGADSWQWSFKAQEWQPKFPQRTIPFGGHIKERGPDGKFY